MQKHTINKVSQTLLLLSAILFIGLTGCKKSDDGGTADAGQKTAANSSIFMTANLNGEPWAAEFVTAVQFAALGSDNWEYSIKGENAAGDEILQFALITLQGEQFGADTYNFGGPGADAGGTVLFMRPGENWVLENDTVHTAQVVISDVGGDRTSGTFSARLMDGLGGTIEVTEGVFESNNYATRQ